jgi:hypothetical protein
MSVRVYLLDGQPAVVTNAETVDFEEFGLSPGGEPIPGIACKNRDGTVIARFLQARIAGWSIESHRGEQSGS